MASKKRNKNPIELAREERNLNRAKKHKRRVQSERRPRNRQWDAHTDDPIDTFERIMPLDENQRRREVAQLAQSLPPEGDDTPQPIDSNGLVIEVSSGLCRVQGDDGHVRLCTVRGALKAVDSPFTNVVTVGDRVQVEAENETHGVVDAIAPRKTHIARPDVDGGHHQQLLAANLDQLLIVQAWRNPNIWLELIDRYIITAERAKITPIICVNKVDLADDLHEVEQTMQPYVDWGYTVLLTSADSRHGLDGLREQLANGKITALAGLSGVGKSSLLSAIEPSFQLRTGAVSDYRLQGTHTTTQALMLPFAGGYVIDTPGIREFGLAGMTRADLIVHYPDLLAMGMGCRFANCTHTHEPDCAVQDAVERGTVSRDRYHSYTVIFDSLPEA